MAAAALHEHGEILGDADRSDAAPTPAGEELLQSDEEPDSTNDDAVDEESEVSIEEGVNLRGPREEGNPGRGMYYAVRAGFATPSSAPAEDGESDDDICPNEKRKREELSAALSPSSVVKIRSAIFLYYEDAVQFLGAISPDHKAEYEAFNSFEEAEEYLLERERENALNAAAAAEVDIRGAATAGAEVAIEGSAEKSGDSKEKGRREPTNCSTREALTAKEIPGSQGHVVAGNTYRAPLGMNPFFGSLLGGLFGNGCTGAMGTPCSPNQRLINNMLSTATAGRPVSIQDLLQTRGSESQLSTNTTLEIPAASGPRDGKENEPTIDKSTDSQSSTKKTSKEDTALLKEKDDTAPLKEKSRKRKRKSHWEIMYQKLIDYKDANGSIEIEILEGEEEDPRAKQLERLRSWCKSQVRQLQRRSQGYTDSDLTADKVANLTEVGFHVFLPYDQMFEKLVAHKAKTGSLDVDKEEDEELFEWAAEQTKMLAQHFQGKSVPLSDSQIVNLKSLGYEKNRRGGQGRYGVVDAAATWNAYYELLVKYKQDHGSFVFPNSKNSLTKQERPVEYWLKDQKNEYKKVLRGEESSLSAHQLHLLTSIGLNLTPRPQQSSWEERMQSLREFVSKHGHCKPNREHPLHSFVSNLRTFYREKEQGNQSCLTDERINDLLEIGFVFRAGKTPNHSSTVRKTWDERFEELLAYKAENGHTLVPQLTGPLGLWVKQQRTEYRRMKAGKKTPMTAEKALRLKEIGFHFDAERFKGRNRQVE